MVRLLHVLPPPQQGAAAEQQQQPEQPLRLAVCQFYQPRAPQGEVQVANSKRLLFDGAERALHMDSIDTVLVSCKEPGSDLMRFAAFNNCSRL